MKKVILLSLVVGLSIFSNASEINAEQRFKQSCVVCHTDKLIDPAYKGNLVGPPADEVLTHIKEKPKEKRKSPINQWGSVRAFASIVCHSAHV